MCSGQLHTLISCTTQLAVIFNSVFTPTIQISGLRKDNLAEPSNRAVLWFREGTILLVLNPIEALNLSMDLVLIKKCSLRVHIARKTWQCAHPNVKKSLDATQFLVHKCYHQSEIIISEWVYLNMWSRTHTDACAI